MLVPLFLGGAYFLLPVLIRQALPEFEPAIPVVHIMVAGSFLLAMLSMPTKMLTTAGYRWGVTLLGLLCLGINAGVNYLAVAVLDWGLEGAAVATVFSYVVAFLLMTGYALSKAFTRARGGQAHRRAAAGRDLRLRRRLGDRGACGLGRRCAGVRQPGRRSPSSRCSSW